MMNKKFNYVSLMYQILSALLIPPVTAVAFAGCKVNPESTKPTERQKVSEESMQEPQAEKWGSEDKQRDSTDEGRQREIELPEGFSGETQKVGEPTDGLTLTKIEHSAHIGFYRLEFHLSGDVVPVTTARFAEDGSAVIVDLSGVRHDKTGNLPLTTESGARFGKHVPLPKPPIQSYGRLQVLDDSLVRYEIRIEMVTGIRLGKAESPIRVFVDIATPAHSADKSQ